VKEKAKPNVTESRELTLFFLNGKDGCSTVSLSKGIEQLQQSQADAGHGRPAVLWNTVEKVSERGSSEDRYVSSENQAVFRTIQLGSYSDSIRKAE
jgi:hypothetical protein